MDDDEDERPAALRVEAAAVERMLAKVSFGRILAVGQTVAIPWEGRTLLALVTTTNNLEPDEQAESLVYHCYRGVVSADTRVHVKASANAAARLEVCNVRVPTAGLARTGHLVHITTCDGATLTQPPTLRPLG